MYLRLEHLYFWRKGKELLKDIHFSLSPGERLGIVGRNGSGKSTLLKLIMGELQADSGSIIRTPGIRLKMLEQAPRFSGTVWEVAQQALQEIRELEQALREEERRVAEGAALDTYNHLTETFEAMGGYQAEVNVEHMLESFGLVNKEQDVTTLSGGEYMRLALAIVLTQHPDILLLDEPTNHLDLDNKKMLARHLSRYSGAAIIASHDRAFLDQVCNQTAFLKDGVLTLYKSSYSRAQVLHSKKDPSGFTGITSLVLQSKFVKETVLSAKHLSKTIDEKILFRDVSLRLESGDKFALFGKNGSGKSSLLKMLSGDLESDLPEVDIYVHSNAKLFYVDQQRRGIEDHVPILEQLTAFVTGERAKMLLALAGIPQELWGLPEHLSPGQRGRAGLAKMIASEANLLFLDEPTNDLDIHMIELLENTLASSDVTCLIVCHDQKLLETLATQIWFLEGGEIKRYASLKDYEQDRPHMNTETSDIAHEIREETAEEKLERLEKERSDVQERLFDPLAFSQRDYERTLSRLKELEDELSLLYDQQFPKPLPSYQTHVNGIEVGADIIDGLIHFTTPLPVKIKLLIQDGIGHLVITENEGHCLLEWSRNKLLHGLIRLGFLHFNLRAIQHPSSVDLRQTILEPAGENWWTIGRDKFERLEGWHRKGKKRKQRNKTSKSKKFTHKNNPPVSQG